MPIGDYPILEVIVRQIARAGFDRITMAVNHQAELIKAFFGDGRKWGLTIDYSMEETPLSTMGPLKLIPDLPDNFLVMNGDILTDLDYGAFFTAHTDNKRLFSISSYMREHKIDYGVLEANAASELTGFREKPTSGYLVSMGIYMLSSAVLAHIPEGRPFGFDDLMHALLAKAQTVNVVRFHGYWLDIGRPDDYAQAINEFSEMKEKFIGH